jgi:hypothetical protein
MVPYGVRKTKPICIRLKNKRSEGRYKEGEEKGSYMWQLQVNRVLMYRNIVQLLWRKILSSR